MWFFLEREYIFLIGFVNRVLIFCGAVFLLIGVFFLIVMIC